MRQGKASDMDKHNQDLYCSLRAQYPEFVYSGYKLSLTQDTLELDFEFSITGLAKFTPHWSIARGGEKQTDINDITLKRLAFSLGMVELVSYWKIACPPTVRISCAGLDARQTEWWKKLYKKGLGEFFYTNGITPDDGFMTLVSEGESLGLPSGPALSTENDKVLIPIGGGKDSAVTLELLRGKADRYCYIINPRGATLDTVRVGRIPDDRVIIANRTLDRNMIELNKQGFLNGHTPFSALVAFSSVIASYIRGISFVALSNESSANESTVAGTDVNHQYSKSLEFERDFIAYQKQYIDSGVSYFSLLRPIAEISIARIFAGLTEYHPIFRSCNAGSKQNVWCAACPKCLFVYIILSPFLDKSETVRIFGRDMLDDIALKPIFDKLTGIEPEKPFECVGSRDEVNSALSELIRRYGDRPLPALLGYYKSLNRPKAEDLGALTRAFDTNNCVPQRFVGVIKDKLKNF